ncbi:MAG TPA: alpha/beta fold hydrolase [Steroidobacteraceae bacterium]|nr:alpha/beta fold hydrolase [Steroidobacteraceae bacterium]
MSRPPISTEETCFRKYIHVLGVPMAYVDIGVGDPIVFLHGNPTPSYLWRNIIPYLLPYGRCLAPDYVGMGNSGPAPDGGYRFFDHQRYLDAWFEELDLKRNAILVVHDWGSALGFAWAQRHPERIKAIVYMEGIVRPFQSWDEWPSLTRAFFEAQRSPAGEDLILEKNLFIDICCRFAASHRKRSRFIGGISESPAHLVRPYSPGRAICRSGVSQPMSWRPSRPMRIGCQKAKSRSCSSMPNRPAF